MAGIGEEGPGLTSRRTDSDVTGGAWERKEEEEFSPPGAEEN